ncbi:MAG: 4-phosphopantetheinyl transferase [Ferruginibacter sp.]|nr:4-phosphopantetheinyl transferase [Ferruginibacter sp.]
MPLVYQQNINLSTKLAVWHIAEAEAFFLQRVSLQQYIAHPRKRLQHLSGRLLLTELFADFPVALIRIAETRRPFLPDDPFHFSISHCGDYAAVIVSNCQRVGIDIEIPHSKIERIRDKFLTVTEQEIVAAANIADGLTMAWSIKESLFKWYAKGQVDFKQHLHIQSLEKTGNEFSAACTVSKENEQALEVKGLMFNGNCLAWVMSG